MKEEIRNTYDIIDHLLDLSNCYMEKSLKYNKMLWKVKSDKRYKDNSQIKQKRIDSLNSIIMYWDSKRKTINNMIDKINNHEIQDINIKFM